MTLQKQLFFKFNIINKINKKKSHEVDFRLKKEEMYNKPLLFIEHPSGLEGKGCQASYKLTVLLELDI